ncbi:DUF397 domain-containing protein [Actinomadura sp. LD22]|uniref:DUF397 domain-containing protein n=1 Tax=Actinomadura physcomitrii TaxID=2650748 RepID=A0A6I4MAA7_9ACTN|nr:DUF397 domain-containing protein [Actinomadura physcomitrii]MVZ99045.1 DUF397 domain-containing protein [Actinomadura physcomitrii]
MSPHNDLSTAHWRKASRSNSTGSDCVEVARLRGLVAVRDSKNPDGPKLFIDSDAWRALADRVGSGEFDIA